MNLYNLKIKFPQPTYAKIIGGHPEGSLVLTQGVVIDTLDDSIEPYYDCLIIGNTAAVYPYTASPHRILSQSQLARLSRLDGSALKDYVERNQSMTPQIDTQEITAPKMPLMSCDKIKGGQIDADHWITDPKTPSDDQIRRLFTRIVF